MMIHVSPCHFPNEGSEMLAENVGAISYFQKKKKKDPLCMCIERRFQFVLTCWSGSHSSFVILVLDLTVKSRKSLHSVWYWMMDCHWSQLILIWTCQAETRKNKQKNWYISSVFFCFFFHLPVYFALTPNLVLSFLASRIYDTARVNLSRIFWCHDFLCDIYVYQWFNTH